MQRKSPPGCNGREQPECMSTYEESIDIHTNLCMHKMDYTSKSQQRYDTNLYIYIDIDTDVDTEIDTEIDTDIDI